ncbi:MAG: TMEM175 family protein [Bacteroidota bacterium]
MKLPHNISRVEAFSDGVFAFAATLLVVSVGNETGDSALQINWLAFLSFAVSFFVLVALWYTHYNFFRRTNYMDNWIIALNAVLLFVVLYYIFPLKSLINTWTGSIAITLENFSSLFQLYSLGFFFIFLCLALMYFRAFQKSGEPKNFDLLFFSRHFGIYVLVSLLSIVLAKTQIGLRFASPGIVYTLLGPLCYIHGVHFKKKYFNA